MKTKKKVIKIAHLYYDLMNLYGETGNTRALKRFVERQGVSAEIHFLTIGDEIDFDAYDFYYIGAGSEDSEMLVLEDLMKYKEDIKKAVEAGKMFLATGNAMELFGKKIHTQRGDSIACLDTFDYQAYEMPKRLVSEIFYRYDALPEPKGRYILGFLNGRCNIVHNDDRMFGFSNNINKNNFYGMTFIGPFLVRNPYFTNLLVKKLFKQKDYEYKKIENTIEFKAYDEFIHNFILVDEPND